MVMSCLMMGSNLRNVLLGELGMNIESIFTHAKLAATFNKWYDFNGAIQCAVSPNKLCSTSGFFLLLKYVCTHMYMNDCMCVCRHVYIRLCMCMCGGSRLMSRIFLNHSSNLLFWVKVYMASLAILIALIIRCFGLQKLELQAGYNVYISLMWVLGIQTHSPPFSSKSIIY